jgi:hypothetical protein
MLTDQLDALRNADVFAATRRRLLVWLSGTPLAALANSVAEGEVAARRKKKRRHKKKRPCQAKCRAENPCGSDGCGGSCGACTGGSCEDGACVCPGTLEVCRGACVAACSTGQLRNGLTCGCCSGARTLCNPNNPSACCTGDCFQPPQGGDPLCTGLDTGEPCDFDGQCFFGSCVTGICN